MKERPTIDQKDIHKPEEEREIKIQLDREHFEDLQFSVAAQTPLKGVLDQRDIYYDFPDFRITNLNRGLRVRFDEGVPKHLEFKSLFFNPFAKTANPWFVEEIPFKFPIKGASISKLNELLPRIQSPLPAVADNDFDSYESLDGFFSQIGLTPAISVTKYRSEYESDEAVLTFDHIEELGYFLEIECKPGHDPISVLEKSLHIPNFRIIREGYNDMMVRQNPKCLPNEVKQARFRTDPKWNILPIEREYVQELLRGAE